MGISRLNRRAFLKTTAFAGGSMMLAGESGLAAGVPADDKPRPVFDLPMGNAPAPVALPHFPHRLHAFIWRNWPLVPTARLAKVIGAKPADILRLGEAMGLAGPPR